MNCYKLHLMVAVTFVMAGQLDAQLVTTGGGNQATFSGSVGELSPFVCDWLEIPENTVALRAFTTTNEDMLLVEASLNVTQGTFFNLPSDSSGPFPQISDTNPPEVGPLLDIFCLLADSWVTTPGMTVGASGEMLDGNGTSFTHFDTTDDGPQTDFQFAEILLVPDPNGNLAFTFSGTIQTAASPTPEFDDFSYSYSVPEPGSLAMLLFAAIFGCADARRRRR